MPKPVSAVPIRVTGTEQAVNKYLMKEQQGPFNIIPIISRLFYHYFKNSVLHSLRGETKCWAGKDAKGRVIVAEQIHQATQLQLQFVYTSCQKQHRASNITQTPQKTEQQICIVIQHTSGRSIPASNQVTKIIFPTRYVLLRNLTKHSYGIYISLLFQWWFNIPTWGSNPYKCGHALYLALGWSALRNSGLSDPLLFPCLLVLYRWWTLSIRAQAGCHFGLAYESQRCPYVYVKNVS